MKRLILGLVLVAATVDAGTVEIDAACHAVRFIGLEDRVEAYLSDQKKKFEPVDDAAVSKLREKDAVWVEAFPNVTRCLSFPPVPKRIVLTEKGKSDPVFTMTLQNRELPLQNGYGAKVVLIVGGAWIPKADFLNIERDMDFHLIYDGREPSKEKWKTHYTRQILGPATKKK